MEPTADLTEFADIMRTVDGPNELVAALFISATQKIMDSFIAEGDFETVSLPTGLIIERGLSNSARQILLMHTHPSGDPRPSRQDILATKRLRASLQPFHIRLCDHIILAQNRYFSFRRGGLL